LNILRGRYEGDEVRFVRSVLAPGDIVIDIGAHIGFFTMHMAALAGPLGKVYSFETVRCERDLLERSIAENRFGDRIVFERAGGRRRERGWRRSPSPPNAELGRRVSAARGDAPLAGNHTANGEDRGARRSAASAAGAVHQDGRRRRGAAGVFAARRASSRRDRPGHPLRAARDAAPTRVGRHGGSVSDAAARAWLPRARDRERKPGAPLEAGADSVLVSIALLPVSPTSAS